VSAPDASVRLRRPGRLFWKFFLWLSLVQIVSIFAIGTWMSVEHRREHHGEPGGPPGAYGPPGVYGPPPPPRGAPYESPGPGGPPPGVPPGAAPHFAPRPPPEGWWPLPGIPPEPFIGGVLASVASAALLAWLLAKPIRVLRGAFGAAAAGDLQVRIGRGMGSGDDEIQDLGRDFDRMVERLQALIGAQRRLLHDVSHEMRSPLARIQAAIGLASQQPGQDRVALERIEREAVRMDRLIGELLALARLQAGFVRERQQDIDLRELLGVIVEDARFEAQSKGRRLQARLDTEAVVHGNDELLRRAIENVVRNAIKYSAEGGVVSVDLRLGATGTSAVVAIQDAGPGVPDPDLEAIFEPFFRSAGSDGKDGHGLGLAIARRVVQMHGGSISAANALRGGLRVQIELPLRQGADPAAPAG
jgi:two-component system OmpR family sensor kinase